jgi:hypothetical protein
MTVIANYNTGAVVLNIAIASREFAPTGPSKGAYIK